MTPAITTHHFFKPSLRIVSNWAADVATTLVDPSTCTDPSLLIRSDSDGSLLPRKSVSALHAKTDRASMYLAAGRRRSITRDPRNSYIVTRTRATKPRLPYLHEHENRHHHAHRLRHILRPSPLVGPSYAQRAAGCTSTARRPVHHLRTRPDSRLGPTKPRSSGRWAHISLVAPRATAESRHGGSGATEGWRPRVTRRNPPEGQQRGQRGRKLSGDIAARRVPRSAPAAAMRPPQQRRRTRRPRHATRGRCNRRYRSRRPPGALNSRATSLPFNKSEHVARCAQCNSAFFTDPFSGNQEVLWTIHGVSLP